MKKYVRFICSALVVAIISLTCYFASGVNAAWHYAMNPTSQIDLNMSIGLFPWQGSEELPDLGDDGQSHLALIERLTMTEYGLNDPSSFLSEYIEDRFDDNKDNAASVAPTPKGNLKDIFSTSEMQKLDFMIHFELDSSDNIIACDIYTFATEDVGNKVGLNASPIYKTELEYRNDSWLPKSTYKGSATTMKYDAKQGGLRITVDPHSWVKA